MVKKITGTELIVFDLDGTLVDSRADIAWSANETLKACGHPPKAPDEIVDAIGWGVTMLLEQLMPGEDAGGIMRARRRFLEIYGGHLVVETAVYPGVMETIGHFREADKKMAVVTNKPEGLARRVMEELGMDGFFGMVLGGDSLPERKPDPGPLLRVMSEMGAGPAATVMVGDSPIDCETGNKAGVRTIGATYGFRGREELAGAGCCVLIDSFGELKGLLG
ncbi:MAG: HAD family hydrolase [Thermodesulfobacteriota bacterium]